MAMTEQLAAAVKNGRELFEKEDLTFYSALDTYENYFLNRARIEKQENFTTILQELMLLRNMAMRSCARKANNKMISRIERQKSVLSLAAQIAEQQGAEQPTAEHRALAEQRIEEQEQDDTIDPDTERLGNLLAADSNEPMTNMIDFDTATVNARELNSLIESNFSEDSILTSLAVESLQIVISELDEEYKTDLQEDLFDNLADIVEGEESDQIKREKIAEAIRSKQFEYHRDARGWP